MTKQIDLNLQKKEAAYKAVELVKNNMVIGLGTGSTASFAVEALAERIKAGLKVVAIPSSERTAKQAQKLGIPLTNFASHRHIDLTIDGADEVEVGSLNLIKGLGGALLREKLVAAASKQLVIIVDETKLVDCLGSHSPVPVEVIQFAWETTAERLQSIGTSPRLRLTETQTPYVTDNGNYILDCAFGLIPKASQLAQQLNDVTGVVENGLFIRMATLVICAKPAGIEELIRTGDR